MVLPASAAFITKVMPHIRVMPKCPRPRRTQRQMEHERHEHNFIASTEDRQAHNLTTGAWLQEKVHDLLNMARQRSASFGNQEAANRGCDPHPFVSIDSHLKVDSNQQVSILDNIGRKESTPGCRKASRKALEQDGMQYYLQIRSYVGLRHGRQILRALSD